MHSVNFISIVHPPVKTAREVKMNYSKWLKDFLSTLENIESVSTEAKSACVEMYCSAQNGCPNPDPSQSDIIKMYNSVMSNIEAEGLESAPYYKIVYQLI